MYRDALPWRVERQLVGLVPGVAAAAEGHVLGPNDCWIAACCVSHGLPLLTRNRKHFEPLEPLGLVLL